VPLVEIVVILVISSGREAVVETVDVRLIVVERVFVEDAVDVLDLAIVRVVDLLSKGVFV
jgi:hypothetical protein